MPASEEIIKIKELLDSGAITQEEFELLKQEAMLERPVTIKAKKPKPEERSSLKTFGVWLASIAIIYFISAMMLGVFGLSITTNPISRLGSGLSGLTLLGMMVTSIAIAMYWKNGKLSAKINGGNGRIKNEWWKYAIGAGFAAWLLLLIAVYI